DIENVMLAAVRMKVRRQDAALRRAARRDRVQQQRAGAVAEQHAGAAVLPIEDAREGLGAEDERGARLPEAQRVVRDRQRTNEAGAHGLYIDRGPPRHAEARLYLDRRRREGFVRGRGGEHDQVEVAAAHAGALQRLASGVIGKVGGQLAIRRDAPLADPGALADPSIRCIEPRRELIVGNNSLGQISAATDDLGAECHERAYRDTDCCGAGTLLSCASSSRIFSRNPLVLRSIATLIALAKPNASVEPWLFTAMPPNPKNIAPL